MTQKRWALGVGFFVAAMLGGCVDGNFGSADDGGVSTSEQPIIFTPGEQWNGPSAFKHAERYASGASYAPAVARIPGCSAFLVGTSRLVTADHCLPPNAPIGYEIKASFGRIGNSESTDALYVMNALTTLGYRGVSILAMANSLSGTSVDAMWACTLESRDGGRDVAYFDCEPKLIDAPQGGMALLYPSDLFGYLDPVATNPGNDTPVYFLTTNRRLEDSAPIRTLLSPYGRVQNRGATPCADGYSSHCTGTQGADILKGSSGGAVLLENVNRVFGVASSSRWVNVGGGGPRTPYCHTNFPCWPNKNMFARFSSKVFEDQFAEPISTLSVVSSYSVTVSVGSAGTSFQNLGCISDEAAIGLMGSSYIDPETNQRRLGNIAVVCSPVAHVLGLGLWQTSNAFVQTAGSLDTAYASTPAASSSERSRWNRYRHTVLSNAATGGDATQRQHSVLCPPGMAISSIEVSVVGNGVHAIKSIVCDERERDTSTSVRLSIGNKALGDSTVGVISSLSCSANRLSFGLDV